MSKTQMSTQAPDIHPLEERPLSRHNFGEFRDCCGLARDPKLKYLILMTPKDALEAQITRYRQMSREDRVKISLQLHELACDMARLGIRRQHPDAAPAQVEEFLRQRLELARRGTELDVSSELDAALSGALKPKQT